MTRRIIYLDNAASTFPKPEAVYAAHDEYFRRAGNPGRGAHTISIKSAEVIFEARTATAALLGVKDAERLIFTPGCTYSINYALQGLSWRQGDVVLVSALEHNAVMRPLKMLEQSRGIIVRTLPYANKGIVDLHNLIQTMLEVQPRLCVFSAGSNVTGELLDVRTVAAICGAHKVPLMIDAAQTAGRVTDSIDDLGVSIWCASGHKGLYSAPGVGLLYVAPQVDLTPTIYGGTGSRSEFLEMPDAYPDRLEAGSLPGPAIASLGAGVRYLQQIGIATIADKEHALAERFLGWARASQVIYVVGNRAEGMPGTGVVSFYVPGASCDVVAQELDLEFGIAVRPGLHCATKAHESLGTKEFGLIRVSFGAFNTEEDVDYLCSALETIASRLSSLASGSHG